MGDRGRADLLGLVSVVLVTSVNVRFLVTVVVRLLLTVVVFVPVLVPLTVIVQMFVVGGAGLGSGSAPPAHLRGHEPGANAQDEDSGRDRGHPVEGLGGHDPAEADDDRRQDEDPQRVRDRHAQAQGDGMDRSAASADQVCAHQCLAVPRRQGMPCTERHRREQRAQQDDRREVLSLEQAGDLAADAAWYDSRAGRDRLCAWLGSRRRRSTRGCGSGFAGVIRRVEERRPWQWRRVGG